MSAPLSSSRISRSLIAGGSGVPGCKLMTCFGKSQLPVRKWKICSWFQREEERAGERTNAAAELPDVDGRTLAFRSWEEERFGRSEVDFANRSAEGVVCPVDLEGND